MRKQMYFLLELVAEMSLLLMTVLTELQTQTPPKKRSFAKELAFDEEEYLASKLSSWYFRLHLAVTPDTPKGFSELVLHSTTYEPEKRPSFKEILSRLEEIYKTL